MVDKRKGKWYRFRVDAPTNGAFLFTMYHNEKGLFLLMLKVMVEILEREEKKKANPSYQEVENALKTFKTLVD